MRVLLIEDDPSLCTFFSRALKRAGYDVTIEHRGDLGLQSAQNFPPDLLVIDCFLPGLNGVRVLRELREQGFEAPILMLSGSTDLVRDEALEAGANAFLAKPCGLEDLTNCVAMLTSRSLVRDLFAQSA